jgi:hypothetical protein
MSHRPIIAGILILPVIAILTLGGMIIFGTAPPAPPMETIGRAFAHVDLSDLPLGSMQTIMGL